MKRILENILKTLIITNLIFILFASGSAAQMLNEEVIALLADNVSENESSNEKTVSLNPDYFKGYVRDARHIVTSPSRWNRNDWLKASLVAGITLGLYAFDEDIRDWVQENRDETTDDIARFAKPFGDLKYTLPPIVLLYLYGNASRNARAERTALLTFENILITGIFTQVIKFTGQRHRPDTGDPYNTWDGPGFSHQSFPSGHSSLAFSIATVIAIENRDKVIIPPLAYGIATLTALSRVNDDKHWASDIFAGAVIAYFTGKTICSLHEPQGQSRIALYPAVNGRYSALMLSYKF